MEISQINVHFVNWNCSVMRNVRFCCIGKQQISGTGFFPTYDVYANGGDFTQWKSNCVSSNENLKSNKMKSDKRKLTVRWSHVERNKTHEHHIIIVVVVIFWKSHPPQFIYLMVWLTTPLHVAYLIYSRRKTVACVFTLGNLFTDWNLIVSVDNFCFNPNGLHVC